MSDISKLFHEEVREKKRAANGVHGRTGRRGYVGKMVFPSDNLSKKEKNEYAKPSDVNSYNPREDVISFTTFLTFQKRKQRLFMEYWLKDFTSEYIRDQLQISTIEFNQLLTNLNCLEHLILSENKKTTKYKEITKMKNELLDYNAFKELPKNEQYSTFLSYLEKVEKISDLARIWEIEPHVVYNIKAKLKKFELAEGLKPFLSLVDSKKDKTVNTTINETLSSSNSAEEISNNETGNSVIQSQDLSLLSSPTSEQTNGLSINQEYVSISGNELKDKLFRCINLLENDMLYQIKLNVAENGKCPSSNKNDNSNREILYAIQHLATKLN